MKPIFLYTLFFVLLYNQQQVFGECCWPVLYEWQCLHRNSSLGGPYDMDMCGDCTPATPFCGEGN